MSSFYTRHMGKNLRGWLLLIVAGVLLFFSIRDGFIRQRMPFKRRYFSNVATGTDAVIYGAVGCGLALLVIGIGGAYIRTDEKPWD